jgi:hypothetical protein
MSTIIATTLSNGSVSVPTATVVNGSAKVWVNFDGTGTFAIRDSFNVASLTDSGAGLYRTNFTNAMSNNSFAGSVWSGDYSNQTGPTGVTQTTTSFDFYTTTYATTNFQDVTQAHVAIAGDLA